MQTIIEVGYQYAGSEPGKRWCRQHGLDPSRVAVPNTLVLDAEQRTITVMVYFAVDEHGKFIVRGDEVVAGPVTVQLEAPALPWSEER